MSLERTKICIRPKFSSSCEVYENTSNTDYAFTTTFFRTGPVDIDESCVKTVLTTLAVFAVVFDGTLAHVVDTVIHLLAVAAVLAR